MSCVVQWWDVLFVKGMHFHQKMHVYLISYYFVSFQQDKFELLKAEGIATPI